MKSIILAQTKSGPSADKKVDRQCKKDKPRIGKEKQRERRPACYEVGNERDKQCLRRDEDGCSSVFFYLRRDEFFGKDDHDDERDDGDGGKPRSLDGRPEHKKKKEGERDERKGHGDAGKIEHAEALEKKACDHADDDHADVNGDPVFCADDKKRKRDEGGRVNAECLDSDNLPEKGDECHNHREDKQKLQRLKRYAGIKSDLNEWVEGKHISKISNSPN